jgi:hypothetical protein
VNEKYEANPKGLLRFRAPNAEEKAVLTQLPAPGRTDVVALPQTNPPPPIEFVDDGLKDLAEINRVWDSFVEEHSNMKCEKISTTEFQVTEILMRVNNRLLSQSHYRE